MRCKCYVHRCGCGHWGIRLDSVIRIMKVSMYCRILFDNQFNLNLLDLDLFYKRCDIIYNISLFLFNIFTFN